MIKCYILTTNELLNKVQQLSNPAKVDNWLKEICIYQQKEIENLNKRLEKMEKINAL